MGHTDSFDVMKNILMYIIMETMVIDNINIIMFAFIYVIESYYIGESLRFHYLLRLYSTVSHLLKSFFNRHSTFSVNHNSSDISLQQKVDPYIHKSMIIRQSDDEIEVRNTCIQQPLYYLANKLIRIINLTRLNQEYECLPMVPV